MRLYRRRKSNGEWVWWASWTEDRRTVRRSTRCSTKPAAELVVARWERERADPVYEAANQATLGDEAVTFLAECRAAKLAPETISMYRQKAGNLLDVLGRDTKLAALDATMVGAYFTQRAEEGASESTLYKEWVTLNGILKSARHRRRYQHDPAALRPPRLTPHYVPRKRFLTPCEIMALLDALPPPRAAIVAFVIATGARRREWENAQRGDVNLRARMVRLRGTKTASSAREIPVPSTFVPLLERALRHGPPFDAWPNARRGIARACARTKQPPATWNDLRRTFASLLVQLGVAPHVVARLMGHTTTAMVDRVYGRTTPESLAALLEGSLGSARRDPSVNHERPDTQ